MNLKELVSLIRINLISAQNIILGKEKRKKRILNMMLLFIFIIASTEFSFINTFNILQKRNSEILLFKSILNIQLILIVFLMLFKIMNTFYLASDWKEMMIYPIKTGNLLLSKCILCYFSSMIISIFALIMMFSYGILSNANIIYYLNALLYEIIITAVPVVYLSLIFLTLFWVISSVKKSKFKYKNNKLLFAIDLAVIFLTYMLFKFSLNNHVKIGSLLFNIFFNGNESTKILINFLITSAIIIISCFGFYAVGGNVYLTIMKSGMFSSKDSKSIGLQPNQYDFKQRNQITSNIIRDAKLIIRIPSLRFNCITVNAIYSMLAIVALIVFSKPITKFASLFQNAKSLLVVIYFLTFQIVNGTVVTSFSREGRFLSQLKVFPLNNKQILLSKICIALLTNIFSFINTNVLIVLISSNFVEVILLQIVLLVYMISTVIIEIEIDINSMDLKWIEIKQLFLGHYLKIVKPYFLLTLIPFSFILLYSWSYRRFHIELTEYATASFVIIIAIVYSIYSYKKITNYIK